MRYSRRSHVRQKYAQYLIKSKGFPFLHAASVSASLSRVIGYSVLQRNQSLVGRLMHGGGGKAASDSSKSSRPRVHRSYSKLPDRMKKWAVPRYMYAKPTFPPFLSGSGYLVTSEAARCVLEESRRIPFIHLEDVYVTGICAEACGIVRYHHGGFVSRKNWTPPRYRVRKSA